MSGFVCAINYGDEKIVKGMLDALLVSNGHLAKQVIGSKNSAVFGAASFKDTHAAMELSDSRLSFIGYSSLQNANNLRQSVKPKPKDNSDAALILSLYRMKGAKLPHYLDGPFAFVICDKDGFFAARDSIGIVPLYYAKTDGGWLFATSLKAFPESVTKVAEFPPGCYFDSANGAKKYYKLPDDQAEQVTLQEAMDVTRKLVTESIHRSVKAEGEVGVYLTGSVESCILAALAAQKRPRLKTFSVGFEGTSDGQTAKKVAAWLGTEHTHVEVTESELLENLQTIVACVETFDAPIVRHSVADYFAVRAAGDSVSALLGADAANELFGGLAYLRPMYAEKMASEIRQVTEDLHKTQLQRWYRITEGFGLEGRMPFTERKLVHAVSRLPAKLKINEDGRSKWVLRRAFATSLPAWIVDRPDADDTHSIGIANALIQYADTVFTDDDVSVQNSNGTNIRSRDEMLYYQIWSTKFPASFVPLVGRTHM